MRSAIRGDFERLARRRGDQELLRVPDESLPGDEPDVAEPEPEAGPQRRSWLGRLFAP